MDIPFDVLFVALQRRMLRQSHVLHGRIEAFAGVGRFFHFTGQVRHEGQLLFHILFGAKPAAGPGMSGNLALPVQRQRLLQRGFPLDWIGVVDRKPRRHRTK